MYFFIIDEFGNTTFSQWSETYVTKKKPKKMNESVRSFRVQLIEKINILNKYYHRLWKSIYNTGDKEA